MATTTSTTSAEQHARHERESLAMRSHADSMRGVSEARGEPLPVGAWRAERLVLIAPVVPSPRPDPVPPPRRVRGLRASAARASVRRRRAGSHAFGYRERRPAWNANTVRLRYPLLVLVGLG